MSMTLEEYSDYLKQLGVKKPASDIRATERKNYKKKLVKKQLSKPRKP
jgi:hypothetical protein